MNNNYITNNLIKNASPIDLENPVSAIYKKHNSIFDLCLQHLSNLYIIELEDNIYKYIDTDIFCSNDLLQHSQDMSLIRRLHLIDLIFCHSPLPSFLKKEDWYLLLENVKDSSIVATNTETLNFYKQINNKTAQDIYHIRYGIPEIELDNLNKKQSIIILNLKKDQQTYNLYNYVKQHYKDCLIIDNIYPDIYNIMSFLNLIKEYKILIDLDTNIHVLAGLATGCIPMTKISTEYPGVVNIDRFDNTIKLINHTINEYVLHDRITIGKKIQLEYSFDNFKNNIYNALKYKIWRPFR